MTSKSDTIDLTTSPTLSASLPVPYTSRNRRPRSTTSSSSRHASSVASEEIIDNSLLPDAGDDHSYAQQVDYTITQLHGRKRRRVDASNEEPQSNLHQLDEARSSSHPPDNNVPEGIPEASTSSQVASDPLLSSWSMSPNLMLDSFSFPLDEENVELPPLTQESSVSEAFSDAGADISEVSVLTQRGTPPIVQEATDATSDDVVVVSPASPQREPLPSVPEATGAASDDVFVVSPDLPQRGTPPSFQETTGAISDDVFIASPALLQTGTPSVPETVHATSDDVVIISPALPPSSLRPIVIDDPTPLDMRLASTPKAASHSLPVFPVNGATSSSSSAPEPLSAYTCPICFSPPTNATLTPCGHICCGACLFAAVKSTVKRNMFIAMDRAPVPRCPVCRAEIPGWDGQGGGVVGLKVQVVYSL